MILSKNEISEFQEIQSTQSLFTKTLKVSKQLKILSITIT